MNAKYSGAYSRRRYSNYAASQGDQDVASQNSQYTLHVGALDPSMGNVTKLLVSESTSSASKVIKQTTGTRGTLSSSSQNLKVYKVTAEPFPGFRFVSWNGLPSGYNRQQNPINVTLDRNLDITANFEKVNIAYHVDVEWDVAKGNVTASQTMNGGTVTVNTGDSVTLHAQPKSGYKFVRWDGVNLGGNTQDNSSDTITLTVSRDLNLKAVFDAEEGGEESGGENPDNGGSDGGNGGGSYGGSDTGDGGSPNGADTKTGIVALAKKYWWVIAAVVLYLICKKGKGGKK